MSCDPGEEQRVEALARELDKTIRTLKGRIGEIGDRRIAVMAALTVLDRLDIAESRVAELTEQNTRLERARERAALAAEADDEPLIARIDAATAAIERLTSEINAQVRTAQSDGGEPEGASFSAAQRHTPAAPPLEDRAEETPPAQSGALNRRPGEEGPDGPGTVPGFARRR